MKYKNEKEGNTHFHLSIRYPSVCNSKLNFFNKVNNEVNYDSEKLAKRFEKDCRKTIK